MKTVGIIAEYNPFHNGHLYQINKIKEMFPSSTIILILSGNFLQRGDVSILNKWTKTKIALENKIDLVVELPFPFATQSADIFAHGAISILNDLKVDYLVFGSESDDIESLKTLAEVQLYHPEYRALAKLFLDEGRNYPTALSLALKEITKKEITLPNDILALSYIKEIIKTKSNITPISIKRTNNYHDTKLYNNIVSATAIRKALAENKDIKKYVPNNTYQSLLKEQNHIEKLFPFFKYKVLSDNNLSNYQTTDEGIEKRLIKEIKDVNSFDELIKKIKTKRYTYNRLMRMCIHILCSFTKEEAAKFREVEYIRLLGFSNKGKNYLNKIKKELTLPVLSNYSPKVSDMLSLEMRATSIYSLLLKEESNDLIEKEYKMSPINIDNILKEKRD